MVRVITADDNGDGVTACCCRRDPGIDVVGRRRAGLVKAAAVGRDESEGGRGCTPVRGGRRARLLARMGVGRRSDGLRVIALAPPAPRR